MNLQLRNYPVASNFIAAAGLEYAPEERKNVPAIISDISSTAFVSLHLQHSKTNMAQLNNPLHGITLENIVVQLVEHYGWEELGLKIKIDCFNNNPGIKSSLKFLRKTPWARLKVEDLYLKTFA